MLDENISSQLEKLQLQVAELESRIAHTKMVHPNFWTRAAAVWGHCVAFGVLLWLALLALWFFIGFFVMLVSVGG